jgi:hypothetical protein
MGAAVMHNKTKKDMRNNDPPNRRDYNKLEQELIKQGKLAEAKSNWCKRKGLL